MNVLIYVVDCLRSDHLSCYGYQHETTPNIDALAADGVRYEQCFAPATWTRPVSVSLLTGMYPPTHGVRQREDTFSPDLPRLSKSLVDAGFETVGVSTMGNVSSTLGYDVGFDQYFDLYKEEEIIRKRSQSSTTHERLWYEDREKIALPRAEDINDYLIPVLEKTDSDLFSFCWSIDPHMPLDPPEEHRDFLDPTYNGPIDGSHGSIPNDPTDADLEHLRALYDGEIRYTDRQVGQLIEKLKHEEEYEESLIILLGDHGEAFGEHDFLFHGNRPYDELLHVPLVVKPPADFGLNGESVSELVSLIDVFPTVLDLVGLGQPPKGVQGRVLPPFGPTDGNRAIFSETQLRDIKPAYRSVRTDRWKYIEIDRPSLSHTLSQLYKQRDTLPNLRYTLAVIRNALYGDILDSTDMLLFDLASDPGEHRNLAAENPENIDRLQRRLDNWLLDCERLNNELAASDDGEIDAATAEQLRQLGYTE